MLRQDSLLRLFLVRAVQAGRMEQVTAFLAAYGEGLAQGPGAGAWGRWFTLPFIGQPENDPELKVGGWQMPRLPPSSAAHMQEQHAVCSQQRTRIVRYC